MPSTPGDNPTARPTPQIQARPWHRPFSIRGWLLALLVMVTLPLGGVVTYDIYRTAATVEQAAVESVDAIARLLAYDIQRFHERSMDLLRRLATLEFADDEDCARLLAQLRRLHPEYANMVVFDLDGQPLCLAVTGPGRLRSDVAQRPWFRGALATREVRTDPPFIGPIVGKWILLLSYAVRDRQGQAVRVLALPMQLDIIQEWVERLPLPPGAIVAVSDGQGQFLARFQDQRVFMGQPATDSLGLSAEPVERIQGRVGVPDLGWRVRVAVPMDKLALTHQQQHLKDHLILGLLLLLAVLVLILLLSRSISRPILALAASARSVAEGQGGIRVKSKGPREVREVADTFNRMLEVRQSAVRALQESEARYRRIVETTREGIWELDAEFKTTFANQRMAEMLGYEPQELLGTSPLQFMDEGSRHLALRGLEQRRQGIPAQMEISYLRKDGTTLWVLLVSTPYLDSAGRFQGVVGMLTDITERRRDQQRLAEAHRRFRELSNRLVEVQEQERGHIARELHDEIGQSLTAVKINLLTATRLPKAAISGHLKNSVAIIDRLIEQVRDLSLDLHPPQLDELGLAAALRWHLLSQARLGGLEAELDVGELGGRWRPTVEIACFRIAQEAITNVQRHARASRLRLRLRLRGGRLCLLVADDGAGFDTEAAQQGGLAGASLGLLGMQERAAMAGGRLRLRSTPGKGTVVWAVFHPLSEAAEAPAPEAIP